MYQLKKGETEKIIPFMKKISDSLIISCIQGYVGRAWINDREHPTAARVISGDFCFLGGTPDEELVRNIPQEDQKGVLVLVSDSNAWEEIIRNVYGERAERKTRYAIKNEGDIFDREKLRGYAQAVDSEYRLRFIDEELYHQVLCEEWSSEFCSQYKNWEYFHRYGLGVVALHDGKVVAGASSYGSYRKGIEVAVVTREDYRRRGLSTACAAQLILACLERGLYPHWDAANMMSVGVAEKMGYHYDREYTAYEITWQQNPD